MTAAIAARQRSVPFCGTTSVSAALPSTLRFFFWQSIVTYIHNLRHCAIGLFCVCGSFGVVFVVDDGVVVDIGRGRHVCKECLLWVFLEYEEFSENIFGKSTGKSQEKIAGKSQENRNSCSRKIAGKSQENRNSCSRKIAGKSQENRNSCSRKTAGNLKNIFRNF